MSTYKTTLVRNIQLLAKDLFENAEKYVPDKEYVTSFDIRLHFPQGFDNIPSIEVIGEYYPDKVCDCMEEEDANKYSPKRFFSAERHAGPIDPIGKNMIFTREGNT